MKMVRICLLLVSLSAKRGFVRDYMLDCSKCWVVKLLGVFGGSGGNRGRHERHDNNNKNTSRRLADT